MAHGHAEIFRARARNFENRIRKHILGTRIDFSAEVARTPRAVPFRDRLALEYRPIAEGDVWGHTWDSAWFRLSAEIPSHWAASTVAARIDVGGEALLFDADGCPRVGLTNGSVFDADYNKDVALLASPCRGGEVVELWLEGAANGLFGVSRSDPEFLEDSSRLHGHHEARVKALRMHQFDYELWQLWLDVQVLLDLHESLPSQALRKDRLLLTLSRGIEAYSREGTRAARAVLAEALAAKSNPVALELTGVGHAHIDTGWLWPVRETIRKCARTFSSQIALIERYPDYVFGASQAQHYAFVKEHYPELYAKIAQAVASGRWEVQGGMWVEADANLIGGESMVRQLVHGKHFFRREFGVDVKNLWLPDVFGYSGNLPQILRKAGCGTFLTQKLSWNRYNAFPHHTFVWRGIDGSDVLAHFPPESNYNSSLMPHELLKAEREYGERAVLDEAVSLFGIGDGGGGPKEEHVERGLRLRDLNGAPRFRFGAAQPVLERLAERRSELPTWVGELYLEAHRGTLTTQAAVKRLNRRAEEALRAAEMLCAAAGVDGYPRDRFDAIWKKVLLNQFHDIIPGSSIHTVYEIATAELEEAILACGELARAAALRLGRSDANALTLFNPSSTAFSGTIALPDEFRAARIRGGAELPAQIEAGTARVRVHVPAQSFVVLERNPLGRAVEAIPAAATELVLENEHVRYEFSPNLELCRAFDKLDRREIVPGGELGNVLSLYEDRPHAWDAWDVDEFYVNELLATAHAGAVTRVSGPVRAGLCAELSIGDSSLRQHVWLEPNGKRLDFVTEVDWRETHKMLRVSFPTSVRAEEASFEIQYGFVRRPTHTNTLWDHARFEVVGHRWADLSQRDYGVSLLNDCKYGYKVRGHVLDLNLLRSPTDPDPVADRGSHRFTYSLLPHTGDLAESDVLDHAAILNQGVWLLAGVDAGGAALPVRVEGDGIELAVVKQAETAPCLVARVFETRGMRARGVLTTRDSGARVVPTDLVEWRDDEPATGAGRVELELSPFEIRSYKIWS